MNKQRLSVDKRPKAVETGTLGDPGRGRKLSRYVVATILVVCAVVALSVFGGLLLPPSSSLSQTSAKKLATLSKSATHSSQRTSLGTATPTSQATDRLSSQTATTSERVVRVFKLVKAKMAERPLLAALIISVSVLVVASIIVCCVLLIPKSQTVTESSQITTNHELGDVGTEHSALSPKDMGLIAVGIYLGLGVVYAVYVRICRPDRFQAVLVPAYILAGPAVCAFEWLMIILFMLLMSITKLGRDDDSILKRCALRVLFGFASLLCSPFIVCAFVCSGLNILIYALMTCIGATCGCLTEDRVDELISTETNGLRFALYYVKLAASYLFLGKVETSLSED